VTNCSLMQEIADTSLQVPAQVCWIYAMDGDIEFLKSIEPYMRGLYHYFRDTYMNEDGILFPTFLPRRADPSACERFLLFMVSKLV